MPFDCSIAFTRCTALHLTMSHFRRMILDISTFVRLSHIYQIGTGSLRAASPERNRRSSPHHPLFVASQALSREPSSKTIGVHGRLRRRTFEPTSDVCGRPLVPERCWPLSFSLRSGERLMVTTMNPCDRRVTCYWRSLLDSGLFTLGNCGWDIASFGRGLLDRTWVMWSSGMIALM